MPFQFNWDVLQIVEAHEEEARRLEEEAVLAEEHAYLHDPNWEDEVDFDRTPYLGLTNLQVRLAVAKYLNQKELKNKKILQLGTSTIVKHRLSPSIRRLARNIRKIYHNRTPYKTSRIIGTWNQVVWAMILAEIDAAPQSPQYDPTSPDIFNSYWYESFTRLASSVAVDDTIPEYVTMPPLASASVNFNDDDPIVPKRPVIGDCPRGPTTDCPHCNKNAPPHLKITNLDGTGVTSCDFVLAMREYLFGGKLKHPGDTTTTDAGLQLSRGSDWMAPRPGSLVYDAQWQYYDFYRPDEDRDEEIVFVMDVPFDASLVDIYSSPFAMICKYQDYHKAAHEELLQVDYLAFSNNAYHKLLGYLREVEWEWEDVEEEDVEEEAAEVAEEDAEQDVEGDSEIMEVE